ncbi:hypothetical protein BSQ39_10775 [Loigolactobacillus backii]|uniref:glycosyltransferase family 2 protein n=1 Tax=Loigolactobacillus backii TaxID=375175 RepID=UPI0007F0A41A|nr:glycosyltransferase family 2 protein [Loigolactobacillus backii]ANK59020.1 hypothetical protein AYR52_01310 [Loigolactobacillus backii]ANK64008.1 hypothetical protein AYR54_01295 [Loigolactobacillus backii]ANK66457.1 hypothetical protein AYR55_01310 [Loigolactobacillus backii]OLF69843.1 hypothetical protein ACX53_05735 [Loigolactobacillus backii]PIO84014.1 hypothetical protein BSQ39_10775 [Loigolactobacillus backii]
MESPKVAILLSTFNGATYLTQQIESIQKQTYQNWQLYIRDDGSSDQTVAIIRRLAKNDVRLTLINPHEQQNLGVIPSFFQLLNHATAPYYMFCDQDDVWLPQKIQVTLAAMTRAEKKAQQPILVHTDLRVVDTDLKLVSKSMIKSQRLHGQTNLGELVAQNSVTGCTVMINQALKASYTYKASDAILMHDWWYALLAVTLGQLVFVDQATILYRQHHDNAVGASSSRVMKVLRGYGVRKMWHSIAASIEQISSFWQLQLPQWRESDRRLLNFYQQIPNMTGLTVLRGLRNFGIHKSDFSRNFVFKWLLLTHRK